MSLNIRSIPCFKKVSNQGIELINREAEYISHKIGATLLNKDFIPDEVIIILSGKARLIYKESTIKLSTISSM